MIIIIIIFIPSSHRQNTKHVAPVLYPCHDFPPDPVWCERSVEIVVESESVVGNEIVEIDVLQQLGSVAAK